MKSIPCLIAIFGTVLLSGSAANAQACSAMQSEVYDFIADAASDADDFRTTIGAPALSTPCAKSCAQAAKGCKKTLLTDLKADLNDGLTVEMMNKALCQTAADPSACKQVVKANMAALKLTFKVDKAAATAACSDENLAASCRTFCTTQGGPLDDDCESAFGL